MGDFVRGPQWQTITSTMGHDGIVDVARGVRPLAERLAREFRLPSPPAWTGWREDGPPDLWFKLRDAALDRWIKQAEHDPEAYAGLVEAVRSADPATLPPPLIQWRMAVRPPRRQGRPPKPDRDFALYIVVRLLQLWFGVTPTRWRERAPEPWSGCDYAAEEFGISYWRAEAIYRGISRKLRGFFDA